MSFLLDVKKSKNKHISPWVIVITFGSIVTLGFIICNYAVDRIEANARSSFISQTLLAATTIEVESLAKLTGDPNEIESNTHKNIKRKLQKIKQTSKNIRFVYLMAKKLDDIIFLVDAEPQTSEDYSPPGQIYDNPSRELINIFDDKKAFVEGPITDRWGTWISGHAIIDDHELNDIPIIIGIDINADDWEQIIAEYRWGSYGIMVLLLLIASIYFFILNRERNIAEEKESSANQLLETVSKLNSSNQALDAYSYTVSHDLQSPLRHMDGYLKIIEEDYSNVIDDTGKEYIKSSRKSAKKMKSMIDALLYLSRISAAELNIINTNLSEIMKEIVSELNIKTTGVKIHDTPSVTCDANLIRIALNNLLENSLKYSSKVENPQIEFGAKNINQKTTFYLKDNGCGFNQQYADKLFKPFQRLHKQNEYEGSGIGLSTVQSVISRHNGNIWAESEEGKGATFYFTLNSI